MPHDSMQMTDAKESRGSAVFMSSWREVGGILHSISVML